jgi:hypothetical protein
MNNTNILATQHASFSEKLPYRFLTCRVVEIRRSRPCNKHDMRVFGQECAMGAINLTHITLETIADYGLANLARYGDTQFPPLPLSPDNVANKCAAHLLFTVPVYVDVFRLSGEPFPTGELVLARHNRLITFTRYALSRIRPFRRRRRITLRPPVVAMRARNP